RGFFAFGVAATRPASMAAISDSNTAWSGCDACTRYLRRNAVKPSDVSQWATSSPSWLQALTVHPPPGTTMTPRPFAVLAGGLKSEGVGWEMWRRNAAPLAPPACTSYATSAGMPSTRVGGPSGHSVIVSVAAFTASLTCATLPDRACVERLP